MRLPGASQTKKGRVSVRLPLSAGPETTCKKCINSRHFYCRGPFFRVGFSSGEVLCRSCIWEGRVRRSEKLESALDNAVHDDAAAREWEAGWA